jgi:hypothetical protein
MRDSRMLRAAVACSLCLIFTGELEARADSSRPDASDPAAPMPPIVIKVAPVSATWGPTLRIGTVVGSVSAAATSATGLGLTVAAGHRFGRVAAESELTVMNLQEQGASSLELGRAQRLGVIVRYDVVRTRSQLAGPNTLLAMFVEAGASQSWTQWFDPGPRDLPRIVPRDTRRVEGQAGFGVSVDHRFTQAGSYPNRVAWHLGWRFAAPRPSEPGYACRGPCRLAMEPVMSTENLEGSVLFQSSLAFTW